MARIDTDIPPNRRDELINYLFHRNGLYCSDIITFNTIQTKGAIRDVCRGLYKDDSKVNYLDLANEICSSVDNDENEARKKYKGVFKYVDQCNGTIISAGTHACGRLVYDHPLDDVVGLCTSSTDTRPISQLYMHELDYQNYVKLDLLGLDTIQLISDACKLAKIPMITPDNVDLNDDDVWNSIRDNTTGIFQWESDTAQEYIKKLLSDKTIKRIESQTGKKPNRIELLSIGNAAIRPAGESYRDSLANGEVVKSGNNEIDEFFADTSGNCVYQEQIIGFLNKFCGFTMGEADVVRRGFAEVYRAV